MAVPVPTRPSPSRPLGKGAPTQPPPPDDDVLFVTAKPKPITPRVVFYAVEKFGKTTALAYAPSPIIIQVRDTGYQTLVDAGLVPASPTIVATSWTHLLASIDAAIAMPGVKTLGIDGITGAERLCQEHVCTTEFGGDWGDGGFTSFNKGYDRCASVWLALLARLDRAIEAGITVVLLAHARTKTQKNPVGADYDRFEPDLHAKTWSPTARWADAILFGKFHTIVDVTRREAAKKVAEQKGKAIGGVDRVVFTTGCDAFVAGNRYGAESELWVKGGAESMWNETIGLIGRKE